jgi:hypothetical protein
VPYVYSEVDALEGKPLVGSHQCAVLVQHYAKAPLAAQWSEGEVVKGNMKIAKGTAVATFVNGNYPNSAKDNHIAFYIRQDAVAIYVMDQWAGDKRKTAISSRPMYSQGKDRQGKFKDPSNNGDALSVIE